MEIGNFLKGYFKSVLVLEGLLEWKVKGYPGKIKEEQLKEFEKELNEKGFSSQKEMMKGIYERFGIEYCQQGISNLLKRIGAKKKVGPPYSPELNPVERVFQDIALKKVTFYPYIKEAFQGNF